MPGSMNLDLPVVGETPGTLWASMLNDALVPLVEEHDHSVNKGVYVKTTGAGSVGINVNGDMNFQDIDPASPGFNSYNRPINLMSTQFIAGTSAGTFPVVDNLNLMANDVDLFFRDGTGALVQLTLDGLPIGSKRYGFQYQYDAITADSGYAMYSGTIYDQYTFGKTFGESGSLLNCQGVVLGSVSANELAGTEVLGIGTENPGPGAGVRIGYLPALIEPDPALYTYPEIWAAEIVPLSGSLGVPPTTQSGFRIQGALVPGTGEPDDGPQHLDLTATAVNTGLTSYWADPNFPAVPLTPQINADDGVIAYWGNPKATSTQTDLFITGSYDQRLAKFYDGIKLKGGGDVDIHVANGTPLSEFALRGGGTNDLTWSWYNGAGVSLMEMVRGGSLNNDLIISQKGIGNFEIHSNGARSAHFDDVQNAFLGNTEITKTSCYGPLRCGYQDATGTDAIMQIGYLRNTIDGNSILYFYTDAAAGNIHTARIQRNATLNGSLDIIQKGTGDFTIWTDTTAALTIDSNQTTTLEGHLYVNATAASGKIIIGDGADSVGCSIEVGRNRLTAAGASFVDFTTEIGGHDFDSRLQRSTDAAGGQLLLQNNGTGNTVLRVGDPAAAVETKRESFGGAGIKSGAIGFDNLETNPINLRTGGADANVACYVAGTAIQNQQNTILARARIDWNSGTTTYSVGANNFNVASVTATPTVGLPVVTLDIAPLSTDCTIIVTCEPDASPPTHFYMANAMLNTGTPTEVEVFIIESALHASVAADTSFHITVIGPIS